MLLAIALGWLYLAAPDSQVTVLTLSLVAALATGAGKTGLLMYCYGLSVTFGATRLQGIPESAIILAAIVVGALGRAWIKKEVVAPDWLLAAMILFVGAYSLLDPADTRAGIVESSTMVILPAALFALRLALASMPTQATAVIWFAAGCAIVIGTGLLEAYQAVGSNYASYTNVRVFASAIGSSNYAAALSVIPGLVLLVLGLQAPVKKALLILVALPFLAAPFVLASRGAVVALACGVIAITFSADRRRSGVRVGRILAVMIAGVATALTAANQNWYVWQRFTNNGSSGEYLSGRLSLWDATVGYIQSHPLTGVGPGHLTDQLLDTYGLAYSHQFYLEALAQLGIFGGMLFLWAIRPKPLMTWSPVVPAIVAIMVDSAIEPVMSTPMGATLFAGLAAVHWSHTRQIFHTLKVDKESDRRA